MSNAFDDFTRDLVSEPKLQPDGAVVSAWLERELADEGPAWVVQELMDEFTSFAPNAAKDECATVVLKALASDEPQAVVWYTLADAMRSIVLKDAKRKADSLRIFSDLLRPLRSSLDHYDAIGADRRALSRS